MQGLCSASSGHHAGVNGLLLGSECGGFCIFNNVCVCVYARERERRCVCVCVDL